jgi:hypothetical protein
MGAVQPGAYRSDVVATEKRLYSRCHIETLQYGTSHKKPLENPGSVRLELRHLLYLGRYRTDPRQSRVPACKSPQVSFTSDVTRETVCSRDVGYNSVRLDGVWTLGKRLPSTSHRLISYLLGTVCLATLHITTPLLHDKVLSTGSISVA